MSEFASIDHRTVDWSLIHRTQVAVEQELRYEYPGPVRELQQCLIVVPADEHGGQRLLQHEVTTSSSLASIHHEQDSFGNRRFRVYIPHVERSVSFVVRLLVERVVGHASAFCEMSTVRQHLATTRLTAPTGALEIAARHLRRGSGAVGLELADTIMDWVFKAMTYSHDVTTIHTTAAEALALGKGVCQDYAHIMLALCRLCGLPARYVSGHMLGEGGTHAWVEVLVESATTPGKAVAVAYDPTHNRRCGPTYITVAVGRDYLDVAPTSGTYHAPYTGTLVASKRAVITGLEPKSIVAA